MLFEHEKLFDSYWIQVFGPPSSLMHLLGKGISVRTFKPPQIYWRILMYYPQQDPQTSLLFFNYYKKKKINVLVKECFGAVLPEPVEGMRDRWAG
jgi:hypothetical protein